jgi:hypothetical protein
MAYMMSDMAAGSTAALQMQKNMAAAPYVQQETAAAAEETQLKLQQDRLKAQYAPQEMAVKMQEDEAILQKNKLSNILTQTGMTAAADAKQATQTAMKSPEFLDAMKGGDDTKAAKILNLAVLGATNDPVEYYKNNTGIELAAQRTATAKRQEADLNAQNLARGLANINKIPDAQLGDYIDNLPEATTKAGIAAVGKINWNKSTPQEKRDILAGQMHSAASQIVGQKIVATKENVDATNASHEKVANINSKRAIQVKAMGINATAKKDAADPYKASRLDLAVGRQYGEEERRADAVARPQLGALRKELDELEALTTKQKLQGKITPETTAEVKRVTDKINDVLKEKNDTLIKAAKRLPESEAKVRTLAELGIVDARLTPVKPDAKPAAKDVPKNTYTEDKPAEPTSKADYDKLPPGSYYKQDGVVKRKKG